MKRTVDLPQNLRKNLTIVITYRWTFLSMMMTNQKTITKKFFTFLRRRESPTKMITKSSYWIKLRRFLMKNNSPMTTTKKFYFLEKKLKKKLLNFTKMYLQRSLNILVSGKFLKTAIFFMQLKLFVKVFCNE